MFRRAPEARFEKSGRKWYLIVGSSPFTASRSKKGLSEKQVKELSVIQGNVPVFFRFEPSKTASLWLYRGRFWWADPALDEREIKALAEQAFERDERRLKRAMERQDDAST